MDRETIIAALHAAGVTDEEAINKAIFAAEPSADSDELAKSLGDLRNAFEREHSVRDEDLAKSLDEAADVVDAVTQGADAILAEFRSQNDAMAKGLVALIREVQGHRTDLRDLRSEMSELTTGNEQIAKALDVPEVPRGLSGASPVPTPAEATSAESSLDTVGLINKALTEIQDPAIESLRKGMLNTAINRLNAGHRPQDVAQEFGLS